MAVFSKSQYKIKLLKKQPAFWLKPNTKNTQIKFESIAPGDAWTSSCKSAVQLWQHGMKYQGVCDEASVC